MRTLFATATLVGAVACSDGGASDASTDASTTEASTSGATSSETSSAATTSVPTTATEESSADSSSGDATTTTGGVCADEQPAIVTDIDETLTISDEEFLMQLGDSTYDPLEREGGAAMITAYADLGYRVMYLTARSETLMVEDTGESARDATVRWLEEHGYPLDPATTLVVLSPNIVFGDSTQVYKAEALAAQQDEGWRFDYAYGNATTDIGAYADAGIDLAATFIIGESAGAGGTVAIEGEDWLAHIDEQIPLVPAVCEAA